MGTMLIHTEDPSQTKAVKAILKALNIKVKILPNKESISELPVYVSKLMKKGLKESNNKQLTSHNDFMQIIKAKYTK